MNVDMEQMFLLGLLIGFLILLIKIVFITWVIKKGVKNAIVEVIDEDALYDNIKHSVNEGVYIALARNETENKEELQNIVAMGVLKALEQYNNGNTKEEPSE